MEDSSTIDLCTSEGQDDDSNDENGSEDQDTLGDLNDSTNDWER